MKKHLILLLLAVVLISTVSAQEVSEKQEIAVFSLSYSDWTIPSGALGIVDQQIIEVLTNLGRFQIKGLEFRLRADDVLDFIDMIKDVNESNMVIDEKYRFGEAVFTEADFEELVASFIIVVPALTFYDSIVETTGDGAVWEVELQTAFTFIHVKDSTTLAQFSIDTFGTGETQREATLDAAKAISGQLDYELRSIEEFQLKSGIIEVLPGSRVIIELGEGMGLAKGDEFSIMQTKTLNSGHTIKESTGLLVISDVKQDVSYGRVLYSDGRVNPGDQLAEVPRMGIDVSAYGTMLFNIPEDGPISLDGGLVGVKSVFARGFYDMRPFVGVEVPLVDGTLNSLWPGLSLSAYVGGELMWFLGRLQIEPSIAFGVTGLVPLTDTDEFVMSHIGGKAGVALNWMLTDSLRLFIDGGYTHWFSIAPDWLPSVDAFGGIFAGLGVTFKL